MAETDEITTQTEAGQTEAGMAPLATAGQTSQPATGPHPPAKRRGGVFAPLIGGALAAVAGYGLAQYVPNGWPVQDTTPLEQQIATQTEAITALEARLAAVEAAKVPDISPLMETLATLNGRMAALETGPAERFEQTAALAEAVAALQAEVKALGAAPVAGQAAAPVPSNITALAAEAEARLKEAEAQAAALKAEAEALTRAAVAQAAFGRLQAAVDSGAPFAAILPDLGQEPPKALLDHAETGLPSLAQLQETFPEAARLALEAALRADMGDSWTERATSFFRSQTGARSLTPREGNDPDAILSRAEAAVQTGDLTAALAEISTLPEAAQAPMAEWRAKAETRQAALVALAELAGKIGG